MLNTGFTRADAIAAVAEGSADAISFGKPYISNPDLAERLAGDRPLAQHDIATLYTQGPEGYIDYPSLAG